MTPPPDSDVTPPGLSAVQPPQSKPQGYRPSSFLTSTIYVISYCAVAVLFLWMMTSPVTSCTTITCDHFYEDFAENR